MMTLIPCQYKPSIRCEELAFSQALDRIFKGKFTTEDGRSSFRGYFLLGKEGFRWWIYGCCDGAEESEGPAGEVAR